MVISSAKKFACCLLDQISISRPVWHNHFHAFMYSHTNCDNRFYLCPSLYWASSRQTGMKWVGFLFAKNACGGWLASKQKHLLICLSHSSTQKRCKSYTVSVVHWAKIWYFTHHTYNLIPVWLSICTVCMFVFKVRPIWKMVLCMRRMIIKRKRWNTKRCSIFSLLLDSLYVKHSSFTRSTRHRLVLNDDSSDNNRNWSTNFNWSQFFFALFESLLFAIYVVSMTTYNVNVFTHLKEKKTAKNH